MVVLFFVSVMGDKIAGIGLGNNVGSLSNDVDGLGKDGFWKSVIIY